MPIPDHTAAVREPLSPAVLARARASIADICAAAADADRTIRQLVTSPQVQATLQGRREEALAPRAPAEPTPALLSLPAEMWDGALADLPPVRHLSILKRLIAAAHDHVPTDPQRAHAITSFVLRHVGDVPLPPYAPMIRRLLAARALLAHARTLVALRAYGLALPIIAAAHAAVPLTTARPRYRMHAQLLRAQVLAALGHDEEALATLAVCALFFIEHIDHPALVDALAAMAVILCVHGAFDLARPALILAEHVAMKNGHQHPAHALHTAFIECRFLGYGAQLADARALADAGANDAAHS